MKILLSQRFLRYLFVGGSIGLVFVGFSLLLINILNISPGISVFISYLITLPISFVFQKQFTFESKGNWVNQASLFLTVTLGLTALNVAMSSLFPLFSKNFVYIFINWVFIAVVNYIFYRKIFV